MAMQTENRVDNDEHSLQTLERFEEKRAARRCGERTTERVWLRATVGGWEVPREC